ncbi:MAG: glycosyltransferase family 2 protein, partial [Gemmatimonadales bacterium]
SQRDVDYECFIFDNASTDRTVALLTKTGQLNLHASRRNIGYASAHNANLARSDSEYFVALNADIRFSSDMLRKLVAHLDGNPAEAIAGPTVLEGDRMKPFPPRRFYPGEGMIPLGPEVTRHERAWINGCCMIIRRSSLEEVNGFDEDYFLYQAETDLCLRLRRAGYRVGHCKDVAVHHLHRQSQRGISEYEYGRRLYKGSSIFWRKHYSPTDVAAIARFQHRLCDLFLNLHMPLHKLTKRAAFARDRLRARRDICAELLDTPQLRGQPARLRPIALRQSWLAIESIRQRGFPLDDY